MLVKLRRPALSISLFDVGYFYSSINFPVHSKSSNCLKTGPHLFHGLLTMSFCSCGIQSAHAPVLRAAARRTVYHIRSHCQNFRGIKCCMAVLGNFDSILFFKFVWRSVTAVTMNPLDIVKCVYILKYQTSCMVVISNHKTV